jgi:hypothetical protein
MIVTLLFNLIPFTLHVLLTSSMRFKREKIVDVAIYSSYSPDDGIQYRNMWRTDRTRVKQKVKAICELREYKKRQQTDR